MVGVVVFFAVLIGIFVLIVISNAGKNGWGQRTAKAEALGPSWHWPETSPPAALGVPEGHPARPAAERLEAALTADYEKGTKYRLQMKRSGMSDKEWDWTWFELKRYFLMCALLRNVPMYSARADEVWHEMLMFTREYEQFCQGFCGSLIHHAPHGKGEQPSAGDRAWFEWVYGELFEESPAYGYIWGSFYRVSLSDERIRLLEQESREELRSQWFNVRVLEQHVDLERTANYLIDRAQEQAVWSRGRNRSASGNRAMEGVQSPYGTMGLMSGLLIFNTIHHPDDIAARMEEVQSAEQRKASGGADSAYACSGYSSKDHEEGSSGHDSGDSGGSGDGGGGDSGGGCGGGCSS